MSTKVKIVLGVIGLVVVIGLVGSCFGGGGGSTPVVAASPSVSQSSYVIESAAGTDGPLFEVVEVGSLSSVPKLGDPTQNDLKAHWDEYLVDGCLQVRTAPVPAGSAGEAINTIHLSNTCGGPLPVAEAKKLVPASVKACLAEAPEAEIGPFVELRLEDEFYPCQDGETRLNG